MTIRLSGARTDAGSPVPRLYEKESGKVMLSVDFKTGEIKWDKEMANKMGVKIEVKKDDFLKAIKNNRTQAEAIKELGISVGSFYKYKQEWAADIATMLTQVEAAPTEVRLDPVDADYQKEDPTDFAVINVKPVEPASEVKNIFEEILNSVDAGSIHKPNTAELEDFFAEPEPVKDNLIMVLDAVYILEDLRYESESAMAVFSAMSTQAWHPNLRKILRDRQAQVDEKIHRIENTLRSVMVAI